MLQATRQRFGILEFMAIGRAISTYADLSIRMAHFVEGIARTFKVKGSSFLLHDEIQEQRFRPRGHGMSARCLTKGPVFLRNRESALAKGEPVCVQDLQNDPRVQYPEAAQTGDVRARFSFPIKSRKAMAWHVSVMTNPLSFRRKMWILSLFYPCTWVW